MVVRAMEMSKAEEKEDGTFVCVCVCVCENAIFKKGYKGNVGIKKKKAHRNVLSLNEVDGQQLDVILYWDDYSKTNFSSHFHTWKNLDISSQG